MKDKRPALQFYIGDWKKDPELRACSLAARGLWIDMLCLMYESPRRGYLIIKDKPPSVPSLARIVGADVADVERLLKELDDMGVYSIEDGAIYCRRMVRDAKRSETYRQNGVKGGNPALVGKLDNQNSNPPDNREVIPFVEDEDEDESVSQSSRAKPNDPPGFVRWWGEYPKRRRTGRKKCLDLWKRHGLEQRADAVIAALRRHRTDPQWTKDGGQFTPMATTYLNQGRYDDDADTEAPGLAISLPPEKVAVRDWLLAQTSHARLWLIQEARKRVPELSRVDDAAMLKTLPDPFVAIVNEYRQRGAA